MTLKEFSQKYGVPYHIVYEASYYVKPEQSVRRDRDFDEFKLYYTVKGIVQERINRYTEVLQGHQAVMNRLVTAGKTNNE